MKILENLIRYEKEYTGLDFKSIQYNKAKHEDLIKDIMCMANAHIDGDRFIIVGVSNNRELIGINKNEFIDSANYQQLIRENIEPQICFDYSPYEIDNKCVGIFKIFQCNDQPYMMKKKFGKLERGDSFIRIGDSQFRVTRSDIEDYFAKKMSENRFAGKVEIYFSGSAHEREITLPVTEYFELPSEKAAKKIRKIIETKKSSPSESSYLSYPPLPGFSVPYEQRSVEELEKNLTHIKGTYGDADNYEFFEMHSNKLNITILNNSDEYIEDASIQIDIDKQEGLIISEKKYEKPKDLMDGIAFDFGYPEIEDCGSHLRIHNSVRIGRLGKWDIKHQIPVETFSEPIRIIFLKNLAGKNIELRCRLYGKNLSSPIDETLRIRISTPD